MLQAFRRALPSLSWAGLCLTASAVTVRIDNPHGGILTRVARVDSVQLQGRSPERALAPGDTTVHRNSDLIVVRVNPPDNARIDVELELPYGADLQARTKGGAIAVEGLVRRAELLTETGDVTLAVPWDATRLEFQSRDEPREFLTPRDVKLSILRPGPDLPPLAVWGIRDRLPDLKITFGRITVNALSPGRVVIENRPIPEDSPIKLPWQAPAVADRLIASQGRSPSRPRPARPVPEKSGERNPVVEGGIPRFTSNVRMVSLSAAVVERDGRPVTGLKPEDFEVIEDGTPQRVALAGSEEVPFNLALLLDLSGSTRRERDAMKAAASRFIGIARPHDRVAAYALVSNFFVEVAPLSSDRQRLAGLIEAIPDVSGGTPLYDLIALSYGHEFEKLPAERNALIVISDGIDNQVYGTGAPSEISFKRLLQAAGSMNLLVYPVFLDPFTKVPAPGWAARAKRNLQALADVTGGRLFVARSLLDLEPVYPQVAEELRSVYTVAYYPGNQVFDGSWRTVELRVKRPGVRVRTRTGYYAR
jgi:Ca-activated chloride channel family protein